MKNWPTIMFALFTVALLLLCIGKSTSAETRISRTYMGQAAQLDPKKRPFCNAFTGCGRKRSEVPPEPPADDGRVEEESLGTLLDLNSEPAVEDLSRQIMSEAKLWEAIQEASQELLNRKQERAARGNQMAGMGGAGGKCGLTACVV